MADPMIANLLARVPDLEAVKRALIRETVIRDIMRETGESRLIVVEQVDAAESMGQEEVLELTDGEPTTLRDTLSRYVDELERNATNEDAQIIVGELTSILNYPWPVDTLQSRQ